LNADGLTPKQAGEVVVGETDEDVRGAVVVGGDVAEQGAPPPYVRADNASLSSEG
jgi:hypothetical protein